MLHRIVFTNIQRISHSSSIRRGLFENKFGFGSRFLSSSPSEEGKIITPIHYLSGETIKINDLELGICRSRMGHLSEASAIATVGGTMVHASVNSQSPTETKEDFLPLTVDYRMRPSAFGKLPDGTTRKDRHGTAEEILVGRFIDRAIRPLFPKGYVNEVQVIVTNHSADGNHDPTVLGVNAASLAMLASKQPWAGPVGCVRVGIVNGELKVNPTVTEMQSSTLDLLYAGTANRTVMIEVGGEQIPESTLKSALTLAHAEVQQIVQEQQRFLESKLKDNSLSTEKKTYFTINEILYEQLKSKFYQEALQLYTKQDKLDLSKKETRGALEGAFRGKLFEYVNTNLMWKDEPAIHKAMAMDKIVHEAFRAAILKGPEVASEDIIRSDGRKLSEIRRLESAIEVLPATHGSSYFARGDTHVISSTTLGSATDCREYYPTNGIRELVKSYFLLQYDFPPYSTGELDSVTGVNRRMIGHGALAEKALKYVMPKFEDFPYTVRVVSECTASNGSSSMASTCGATLSLRAAGVPLVEDVAGISMGLITDPSYEYYQGSSSGHYRILTDILGSEDHHGDMDFKIAGTKNGVTAIQLDVKLSGGIPMEILFEALDKAKIARLQILDHLKAPTKVITSAVIEKNVPVAALVTVDPERIGQVIGPSGEMLKAIEDRNNVTIETSENILYVLGQKTEEVKAATDVIKDLGIIVKVNDIYEKGIIDQVNDYGLVIKLNRAQVGLLHISELTNDQTIKSQPLPHTFKVGQVLPVKVISVESLTSLIKLSRKALLSPEELANPIDEKLRKVIEAEVDPSNIEDMSWKDQIKPPKKWEKGFFRNNVVGKESAKKNESPVARKKTGTVHSSSPNIPPVFARDGERERIYHPSANYKEGKDSPSPSFQNGDPNKKDHFKEIKNKNVKTDYKRTNEKKDGKWKQSIDQQTSKAKKIEINTSQPKYPKFNEKYGKKSENVANVQSSSPPLNQSIYLEQGTPKIMEVVTSKPFPDVTVPVTSKSYARKGDKKNYRGKESVSSHAKQAVAAEQGKPKVEVVHPSHSSTTPLTITVGNVSQTIDNSAPAPLPASDPLANPPNVEKLKKPVLVFPKRFRDDSPSPSPNNASSQLQQQQATATNGFSSPASGLPSVAKSEVVQEASSTVSKKRGRPKKTKVSEKVPPSEAATVSTTSSIDQSKTSQTAENQPSTPSKVDPKPFFTESLKTLSLDTPAVSSFNSSSLAAASSSPPKTDASPSPRFVKRSSEDDPSILVSDTLKKIESLQTTNQVTSKEISQELLNNPLGKVAVSEAPTRKVTKSRKSKKLVPEQPSEASSTSSEKVAPSESSVTVAEAAAEIKLGLTITGLPPASPKRRQSSKSTTDREIHPETTTAAITSSAVDESIIISKRKRGRPRKSKDNYDASTATSEK